MRSNLEVRQESEYIANDTWKWAVWLEGPADQLDAVESVVYTLHRSFPNPVRTISNRGNGFRLESTGWGTFTLYVEVIRHDGERIELEHELELFYPEDSAEGSTDSSGGQCIEDRMQAPGPKKLLSIDSGGIRAMVAIEVLAATEEMLRKRLGRGPEFVLADYFDYVAGTSTGALVAACVSQGMSMSSIRSLFVAMASQMFERAQLLKRLQYKYEAEPFAVALQNLFGIETTLGSSRLRTLFMAALRNATSDTAWLVTNNPRAKFNSPSRFWSELQLPLWQVVRASCAAPTWFPPEVVALGGARAVFLDGTLTGFGNPSFQLFLRATAEPFAVKWPVGEDKLLLTSVGTGHWQEPRPDLTPAEMSLLYSASSTPVALLSSAGREQDLLCRMFGKCLVGPAIDREVGDMVGMGGPMTPKLFTYLRYDVDLSRQGLDELGLSGLREEDLRTFDQIEHLPKLQQLGQALAQRVLSGHYAGFLENR